MNLLVFVLVENNKTKVLDYINRLYPNSQIDLLLKNEVASQSASQKIAGFRKKEYDLAIVFSEDLQYQTKIHLLKGLLLLSRAKNRKIIDDKGGEVEVNAQDFAFITIPCLIGEGLLAVLSLLFSFLFLNTFLIFLRAKRTSSKYGKKGDYIAYSQSTFAFSEVDGGDSCYRVGIAEGLAEWGCQMSFFTCCDSQFKGLNNPVHVVKPGKIFDSVYALHKLMYNFKFIWQTARVFSQHRPMALMQFHSIFDCSGAILATLFNMPFFLDVHGISHWKLSGWQNLHLVYFAKLSEKICLLRADKIFTVSQELKNVVSDIAEAEKIVVKINGADVKLFAPLGGGKEIRQRYNIEAEVVVGYAGSFDSTHGIEIIAKAVETISKRTEKIHFMLIGEGNKYPYFKDFVRQKGLTGIVSLTGNVPHKQIPRYLDACDILMALYTQTNTKTFGSPMKLFEYMAMGKAVVATTQGQIPQIIDDGEDGLLILLEDENSLAEAILSLADNKALRVTMGQNARQKILKNYTWKNTVSKIVNVYQEATSDI